MNYTFDTNILINFNRHYPRDIFPSLWLELESVIDLGKVCICEAVLHELGQGGDELHKWAKQYNGLVCKSVQLEIDSVAGISKRFPEWVRETKNAADPFIVAHAQFNSHTIVTEEKRAGVGVTNRNQKIPNVADHYSIKAIDFFEFARNEKWQF